MTLLLSMEESTALGGAWGRKLVFTSNKRCRIRLHSQKLSNTSTIPCRQADEPANSKVGEDTNERSGSTNCGVEAPQVRWQRKKKTNYLKRYIFVHICT